MRIAEELANIRPSKQERYWYSDIPLGISIDPSLSAKFTASIPWGKVWDILTDLDYEESARRLQQACVVLSDGQTKSNSQFALAENAFYSHVELLTKMLPTNLGSLEVDQSSRILRYTKKIIDSGVGPIIRTAVNTWISYTFGIPLYIGAPISFGIAIFGPAIESNVRLWSRRGSLRGAILRSVQLGG